MKKLLAILLTAMLAVTAFTTTAFAATDSPEKLEGIITAITAKDGNGNDFELISKNANSNPDLEAGLSKLADDKDLDLKIANCYNVKKKGDGEPNYPLAMTFTVPGLKPSEKCFVLLQKEGTNTVEEIAVTSGDGVATCTFNALGTFAFVIEKTAAPSGTGEKSDKTADTTAPIIFSLIALSFVVGAISVKKIKNI